MPLGQDRVEPWLRFDWDEEIKQRILRDWGIYLSFKQKYESARKYYEKSLELNGQDADALYYMSMCKSDIAAAESACKDAMLAVSFQDVHHKANLQVCDALYQLNNFEDCKIELSNKSRKFKRLRAEPFYWRMDVVDENFMDCLGPYLGPFFLKNSKVLEEVAELWKKKMAIDPRPLWKILRDAKECDVVSELIEEEKLLHPREVARRALCFRVFCELYFMKHWIDVDFLKSLKINKILLLPQTKGSTPYLKTFIENQYAVLIKFLKMLHARSPLYTERLKMFPNEKWSAKFREDHLFRVQYQTRRDMFIILDKVKMLRTKGELDKLVKFVEHAMGDYVILKTRRVMPRKFEFINEIYNILGLAYLDQMNVPENLMEYNPSDRLNVLMNIPIDRDKNPFVTFVFGDRSTHTEPDAVDFHYIAYKHLVARLEKRIRFADYPIEKGYLYHETAKNHLNQSKFEECLSLARKSLEESRECKNHVWMFLAAMMICRVNATQRKVERVNESLVTAISIAKKLKDPRINHFIDTCKKMNDMVIAMRKKNSSTENMK